MKNAHLCMAAGLAVFGLLPAAALAGPIIVGSGGGSGGHVKVFDGKTGNEVSSFFAYGPSFAGGVRVAAGDVDGDGVADIITGAGPGGGPHVKVFDGNTGSEVRSIFAFDAGFQGGVNIAAGDVTGDGVEDIVAGSGAAASHVKVFDGRTGSELRSFFASDAGFQGGVTVAAGDVDGDGHADIITGAGPGGGPRIKVFDGRTGSELRSFFSFDAAFQGGVNVAAGDVNGDGLADIITGAGLGGGPHVKVFDGRTGNELASFFAFEGGFSGGVRVAVGDVDGDGFADIVTGAGPGGLPVVKIFDGQTYSLKSSFLAFDTSNTDGVFVAVVPAPGMGGLVGLVAAWAGGRRRR
jgi:hypothetical protein